jgi:hypothetical protein
LIRWGVDGRHGLREQSTAPNPLGLHIAEIDTQELTVGRRIDLTLRFERDGSREGGYFRIRVIRR